FWEIDLHDRGRGIVGVAGDGDLVAAGLYGPGALDAHGEALVGDRQADFGGAVRGHIGAREGGEAPVRALEVGAAGAGVDLHDLGCVARAAVHQARGNGDGLVPHFG